MASDIVDMSDLRLTVAGAVAYVSCECSLELPKRPEESQAVCSISERRSAARRLTSVHSLRVRFVC